MTKDQAKLKEQEKTITRMQRQWDQLERKNTELERHNATMFDYILARCEALEVQDIRIVNEGPTVFLVEYRAERTTRIAALEYGEALAKVLP